MRRSLGGYGLLVTGFLLCPCHLPLVVPLLAVLFGGTALGSWLTSNTTLVYVLAGGYFIAALTVGLWLLNRRTVQTDGSSTAAACCPPARGVREQAPRAEGKLR